MSDVPSLPSPADLARWVWLASQEPLVVTVPAEWMHEPALGQLQAAAWQREAVPALLALVEHQADQLDRLTGELEELGWEAPADKEDRLDRQELAAENQRLREQLADRGRMCWRLIDLCREAGLVKLEAGQ